VGEDVRVCEDRSTGQQMEDNLTILGRSNETVRDKIS
jgi:hypothetical protein